MSYTRHWSCEACGQRQETIDWPRNLLCERCDNKTRLHCLVCGHPTSVTPQDLYRQRRRHAVHSKCVLADPGDLVTVSRETQAWDNPPQRQEFNPLGGAARGIGKCTCLCGPGTNPGCQVHP